MRIAMNEAVKTKLLFSSLCILALSAYAGCMSQASQQSDNQKTGGEIQNVGTQQSQNLPMKTVSIDTPDGKVAFNVQIAETVDARVVGLMYRQQMPMNQGMIFLFEKEQPLTFWMKNTLIPLDMVFMDKDWKVISIQKQAQPCKADPCILYPSSGNAQYVLEINGGLSDKLGIEKGAQAQLQ